MSSERAYNKIVEGAMESSWKSNSLIIIRERPNIDLNKDCLGKESIRITKDLNPTRSHKVDLWQ